MSGTREPQTLSSPSEEKRSKKTAISWTGGKDCNLALLSAWRDERFDVVCLLVFRPEEADFKAHPLQLMEEQARCLGLPLYHIVLDKNCKSYKDEYVRGMKRLREDHDIEVIATGDMDLVGTMARNWIEECGEEAGIEAFLPLWKADRAECLDTLRKERFTIIFSCVKSPWFDASWIGRQINDETVKEMQDMASMNTSMVAEGVAPSSETSTDKKYSYPVGTKPLDLGGERGEYHTMCLDGPLYLHRVEMEFKDPIELVEQRGQKEGQRWWTISIL